MKREIKGIITQKKGSPKWYIVLAFYNDEGRRKRKWIATGFSGEEEKKEAERMLAQKLDELNDSVGFRIDLATELPELTKAWLAEVKQTIRKNTYESYQMKAQKIIDYYGKHRIPVVEYSRREAKQFMIFLLRKGKKNQKTGKPEPMAASSVRDVMGILRQVLEYGMDNGIIKYNPVVGIKIPQTVRQEERIRKEEKEKYLTPEEARQFVSGLTKDDPIRGVILMALELGLRRSEILGIKWENVDFENNQLSIENTVTHTLTRHEENNTKNITSRRVIPLTEDLISFFRDLKDEQKYHKADFGPLYTDSDYVFRWVDGRPFRPDFIYKRSKSLLTRAGHPDLTFHSFRHTWVSAQIAAGVSELQIQRQAGHAAGSDVTRKIYTHMEKNEQIPLVMGLIEKINK